MRGRHVELVKLVLEKGGASDGSRHWEPSQASAASKWNKQTIISMYASFKLFSINFKYFATLF